MQDLMILSFYETFNHILTQVQLQNISPEILNTLNKRMTQYYKQLRQHSNDKYSTTQQQIYII